MRSLAIDKSLEGIAGYPLALNKGLSISYPPNIGPKANRTIYVLFRKGSVNEWGNCMHLYYSSPSSGSLMSLAFDPNGRLQIRVDSANGTNNAQRFTPVLSSGSKYIICLKTLNNFTNIQLSSINIGSLSSFTSVTGDGILEPTIFRTYGSTSGESICGILFNGTHDNNTSTTIMHYLMSKYA